MATKEDLAVLQHTMPTGEEGLEGMINYTKKCNTEVKNLLYKECDILIECRYCRNIFRSLINFVSHKRTYCRLAYVKVAAQPVEDDGKAETATKKRTGQVLALTKKMQETQFTPIGDHPAIMNLYSLPRVWREMPITTYENGMQRVVNTGNAAIASKEFLPKDRVAVVMPQDNSSKYKEMSLRNRKMPVSDKPQYRELSDTEYKIIEIFEKYDVRCANYVLLQCEHPLCAHIRPFHTLQALAYHCSLRHTKAFVNEEGEDRWPCLLCNRNVYDLDGVKIHMLRIHSNVKEDHLRKRVEEDKSVKGRKSMYAQRRARSLSLDPNQARREQASQEPQDNDSMDELEEEEGRGRRRGATTASRRGSRGGSIGSRRASRPLERQTTRVPSGNSSEDYGEPPVLQPIGPAVEDESMEDEEEAPVAVLKKEHKTKSHKKKKRAPSPDSEVEMVEEKILEENFVEENFVERDIKVEEEDFDEEYFNSVEGCLADVIVTVCAMFGSDKDKELEKVTMDKNERAVSPISSPPVRSDSSKKRGRPKKTDEEREREKNETPKVGRPPKRSGESTAESVKVKRQYNRKKTNENNEKSKSSAGAMDTPNMDISMDSASSDVARPSRQRKRPAWMMNGDMEYDGVEKKSNDHVIDDSEGEGQTKEEHKKKKAERVSTPKVSVTPTPAKTPVKKVKEDKTSKHVGVIVKKEREPEILLFTPKSGKVVMERIAAAAAAANGDDEASGSRKRKQNLGKLADTNEEIMIVSVSDPAHGPKRSDLSSVPVFLSEQQQSIFFAGLMQHKDVEGSEMKEYYECIYCNAKLPNIRDGRRHMVAHLRVMRLRCGLCGAGAFFCIDMRNHLQLRGCPELHKAPAHMIRSGIPCMTKEHADELTFVAHGGSPGRALFTSGKIVSILSNQPYLPDLQIEERILGPTRVPPRSVSSSPRKPQHKMTMAASVLKEAEKGTMSVADVHRSSSASASDDAPPALLPIEDASVRYYEDTSDPENATRASTSARVASPIRKAAAVSYEEWKRLRTIGEPSNGGDQTVAALPARRALSFTMERSLTASTSPERQMPLQMQPPTRHVSESPSVFPTAPTYEPILSPRPRLLPSRSTGGTGN